MRRRDCWAALSATAAWPASSNKFDPDFGTAIDAAAAIRARKISAAELAAHTMRRMERLDAKLNSICWKFPLPSREPVAGPLSGVPINVKESYGVAGSPSTWGFEQHKDYRTRATCPAIARLEKTGAWVAAKTNVPVALADWQSDNPIYGVSNNPWDLARTCGGSSGGSAAALAAGFGFLSMGSDIGGSIRVPAHFCGIFGHKPSLDLVPRFGHAAGPASEGPVLTNGLSVCGPMARSARDLALALKITAGPAGDDAIGYRANLPAPRRTKLNEFRVGYWVEDPACPLLPDVAAVVDQALTNLGRAGVRASGKGLPAGLDGSESLVTYKVLLDAAMNISGGEKIPFDQWRAANAKRLAIRAIWQEAFRDRWDVFLMPVAFSPAFPHDRRMPLEDRRIAGRPYLDMNYWQHFPVIAGLPSTAVPIGRTDAGLPVGLQVIGPYLEDYTPIEFAALMEPVCGGFVKPPLFS